MMFFCDTSDEWGYGEILKTTKICKLSSTGCKYRLRYSTPSSSDWPERPVMFHVCDAHIEEKKRKKEKLPQFFKKGYIKCK